MRLMEWRTELILFIDISTAWLVSEWKLTLLFLTKMVVFTDCSDVSDKLDVETQWEKQNEMEKLLFL